jgi:hypothetical protein
MSGSGVLGDFRDALVFLLSILSGFSEHEGRSRPGTQTRGRGVADDDRDRPIQPEMRQMPRRALSVNLARPLKEGNRMQSARKVASPRTMTRGEPEILRVVLCRVLYLPWGEV